MVFGSIVKGEIDTAEIYKIRKDIPALKDRVLPV